MRHQKKNSPQGKKLKERTSPATSENEEKIESDESSDDEKSSRRGGLDHTKVHSILDKTVRIGLNGNYVKCFNYLKYINPWTPREYIENSNLKPLMLFFLLLIDR